MLSSIQKVRRFSENEREGGFNGKLLGKGGEKRWGGTDGVAGRGKAIMLGKIRGKKKEMTGERSVLLRRVLQYLRKSTGKNKSKALFFMNLKVMTVRMISLYTFLVVLLKYFTLTTTSY